MSRRNDGEPCASCGKPAQGFATIDDQRYCHGDGERPTCYMQEMWERSGASAYGPMKTMRWAEGGP